MKSIFLFVFAIHCIASAQETCKELLHLKTRTQLLAEIRSAMRDPRRATSIQDVRMLHFLNGLKAQGMGAVTLAVGNSTEIHKASDLAAYEQLAAKIAQSGRYVFYDADASTAEAIRKGAGPLAIGISTTESNSPEESLIVPIRNEHMRLSAFGDNIPVIAGIDSFVGVALLIFQRAKFVYSPDGRWTNPLQQWSSRLENDGENLGLYFGEVLALRAAGDLHLSPVEMPGKPAPLPKKFSRLNKTVLLEALQYAEDIADLEEALGDTKGAVIFGSSGIHRASAPTTYEVSYALGRMGIRGTSGGAGGTMRVANSGFFDAGAESVGIPITGRSQLRTETRVYSEVQTISWGTPGYDVRVYGLLHNQSLIINAPGGSGTMREIAATLMLFSGSARQERLIAFIHSGYYAELTNMLLSFPLPRAFKNRLIPSLTAENVPGVLQRLYSFHGFQRLGSPPPVRSEPRFKQRFE